ncbi:hypothetical protein like AT5G17540 [Hibiscus trionum]|uniref:Uncharacterized protein n=1 Tax=Hibiscus trionum TaxID=183268 RepID=A0A9W7JCK0_HIBTR|nr:hypothetical protein like AT5G17540 [Hibiscus trionum]
MPHSRTTATHIPLTFTVRHCKPEFVAPAKPTPCEQKLLSDIDDQATLRFQIQSVHFYRHESSMEGKHPAEVIRMALAQTLVLYYPFAGRLREGANGKLIVDCNGEGVLFIKADADVRLEQFGDALQPPFPCFNELLFDVPGTAPGLKQFLSTVAAMARGEATHLIPPVWERHLLDARDPPRVTFTHHEYDEVEAAAATTTTSLSSDNLVERSFFFGPAEVSLLHRLLPLHLRHCTKFELLTAFLWRCRRDGNHLPLSMPPFVPPL